MYYISNIRTGTLTIIDGSSNSILKSIYVGKRPFKIAALNNKIYAACDRDNAIAIVNCLDEEVQLINIPNDGNIEIDDLNKRIFVSDTCEINIYDMDSNKNLTRITGFLAIADLKLSKDKNKLYVIDKLLKDFRIYSTDDFKLIYRIEDIGINPGYILLSNAENIVYISLQCNGAALNSYHILKIDIDLKSLSGLTLPKGSIISGMTVRGNTLYAANRGLNRIELINIEDFKTFGFIPTSLPEPVGIFQTDTGKLIVTNRNSGGTGGIDIIDIATNHTIGQVLMDTSNSQPYEGVSINIELPSADDIPDAITDLCSLEDNNETITIVTKRVFSCCHKKVKFPKITVRLLNNKSSQYIFEGINFKKGFIVKDSEIRVPIEERTTSIRIQFLIRIPYTINYKDALDNKYSYEGFLEKTEDIIFDIPKGRDDSEFQLILETNPEVIKTPSLIDNILRLEVVTFTAIKIIGDDLISFPAVKCYSYSKDLQKLSDDAEESFKPFEGHSEPLFPKNILFPYLHNGSD